ncbi:MAG: hypothetical protein QHH06_06205 [Clostridiales bacterium]|jgi:hypothetical protein|nr:hypothetical protein [Eubacteriales bacterium]MDH7566056.1 hypothetical protein [Clostridiales bacterium]
MEKKAHGAHRQAAITGIAPQGTGVNLYDRLRGSIPEAKQRIEPLLSFKSSCDSRRIHRYWSQNV